jgi:hypothetical protein
MLPPFIANQNFEKSIFLKTVKRSGNYASRNAMPHTAARVRVKGLLTKHIINQKIIVTVLKN